MKKIFLTIVLGLCACAMMAVPPSKKGAVSVRTVRSERVVPPPPSVHPQHVRIATPQQVNEMVRVLKKLSFDDNRMEVAKLCVMLCPIATADLAKMASTFTFDSNRLAFYKFAYDYCPDKERYLMLKDSFKFSSDSREFVNFVAKMQQ
ncbi:MAG: DUF4476 domain-containing protein [Bacteroidales bacterium]|nr:DUF4476 domain-containing protein [Bacteroidales bacterium]